MDKNKADVGILTELAFVTDKLQQLYSGKISVIMELDPYEFEKSRRSFDEVEGGQGKFKIDISGTDFIYLKVSEE